MRLETIRGEIDSPGWLDRLTDKYKRDHAENLRKADEKRKREKLTLVNEIVAKLGKQDPKITTTEVEKLLPTENKVEAKAILDVLKEITETLENHARAIEDLADKVDQIAKTQSQRPQRQGDFALTKKEPSQRDLEIIENRFEQIGLTGEIRKILPFTIIGGRFSG